MGSDEVLDFSIKHEGDGFWRRHCPVAYPPIDDQGQVNLGRAAGKVQGAHSGLALSLGCQETLIALRERLSQSLTDPAGYRDNDWFYILGDTWSAMHARLIPTEEAKRLEIAGFLVRGDGKNI